MPLSGFCRRLIFLLQRFFYSNCIFWLKKNTPHNSFRIPFPVNGSFKKSYTLGLPKQLDDVFLLLADWKVSSNHLRAVTRCLFSNLLYDWLFAHIKIIFFLSYARFFAVILDSDLCGFSFSFSNFLPSTLPVLSAQGREYDGCSAIVSAVSPHVWLCSSSSSRATLRMCAHVRGTVLTAGWWRWWWRGGGVPLSRFLRRVPCCVTCWL